MYLLTIALMLAVTACSGNRQEAEEEGQEASKPTQEITLPSNAATVREEHSKAYPLEEFTFTSSYEPKEDLPGEFTVWGYEYDVLRDKLQGGSLSQERADLRCTTTVLSPGTNMWGVSEEGALQDYLDICINADDEEPAYNVQQSFTRNEDDSARFYAMRYNASPAGAEGYLYAGSLYYTDGTSVSCTRLTYLVDGASENGYITEESISSLLSCYGLDYKNAEWKDIEAKPEISDPEFEEFYTLEKEPMEDPYGPVKTFAGAPVYNYADYLTSIHPSGVKVTYALKEEEGISSKKFLRREMKKVRDLAESTEGAVFTGSDIVKREDGTFYCSFSFTDKDGKVLDWIYAAKKLKGTGMRAVTIITKSTVFEQSQAQSEVFDKTAAEFGFKR